MVVASHLASIASARQCSPHLSENSYSSRSTGRLLFHTAVAFNLVSCDSCECLEYEIVNAIRFEVLRDPLLPRTATWDTFGSPEWKHSSTYFRVFVCTLSASFGTFGKGNHFTNAYKIAVFVKKTTELAISNRWVALVVPGSDSEGTPILELKKGYLF